jgi:hypothetical protein
MNQKAIKTYVVAGIIYELRPLVFGQWQQLTKIINGLEYPEQITPRSVVETFGSRLDELLAVILTEEKKSPADKDLAATASSFTPPMAKSSRLTRPPLPVGHSANCLRPIP